MRTFTLGSRLESCQVITRPRRSTLYSFVCRTSNPTKKSEHHSTRSFLSYSDGMLNIFLTTDAKLGYIKTSDGRTKIKKNILATYRRFILQFFYQCIILYFCRGYPEPVCVITHILVALRRRDSLKYEEKNKKKDRIFEGKSLKKYSNHCHTAW